MINEIAKGLAEAIAAMPVLRPQPGPQTAFLNSKADIAIYGGAAGGGKSYGLLLAPLRHIHNPGFSAVVFRRTLADVKKPGSIADTSKQIYPDQGGDLNSTSLEWRFTSGAKVAFGHLEHEANVFDWQGASVPLICFDELTHFNRGQFFYLLSRNRSTCGVKPYVRATTNPDADSWVAEFISWWLDPNTGSPIMERSGVLRWFARISDVLQWGDSKEELQARFPECEPKSLTFIPARLEDNQILTRADPGYRSNLLALQLVDRERLLGGNWKIRPAAGMYFRRSWCDPVDAVPFGTDFVRGWDLAATIKTESNDPDWTAGCKIGRMPDGRFIVADHRRLRGSPREVERELLSTAQFDGRDVRISIPQDPGQAGKSQVQALVTLLQGFTVRSAPVTGSKITRFGPFSAQAQAGNVVVLRGPWNDAWLTQLEGFPESPHDDDADATAEAFNLLTGQADGFSNWIGFIRNELGASGAGALTLEGHALEGQAAPLARLLAPEGVSHLCLMSGRSLAVSADRICEIAEEDVPPLLGAGFTRL